MATKRKGLHGWERFQVRPDVSDPAIAEAVREASAQFYPPKGAMEAGEFRPPRSPVKISVPDGLLIVAELLAKEKGITRNRVLSGLVANELFLALRELRIDLDESDRAKAQPAGDDDIPV